MTPSARPSRTTRRACGAARAARRSSIRTCPSSATRSRSIRGCAPRGSSRWCKARGYTGSVVQLRRAVRLIRPAATATVYRRLTTLAAEEAQVDWGAFGSIRIGRGVRPLSGFVMVLAYSRAVFALFTVDQTLESFLRGHVEAFAGVSGRRAHPGLRQSPQRRPRTRRHRDSVSSAAARARRPLSLRPAAVYAGAGQ